MVGSISPLSVQSLDVQGLAGLQGVTAPYAANASASAAQVATAAGRSDHKVCAAALTPAAMSALIEAQETVGHGGNAAARAQTAHKLDDLLSKLDNAAPPGPPPAQPGFAIQMLLAARQQLAQVYA